LGDAEGVGIEGNGKEKKRGAFGPGEFAGRKGGGGAGNPYSCHVGLAEGEERKEKNRENTSIMSWRQS